MKNITLLALIAFSLIGLTGCERIGKWAAKEYINEIKQELIEKEERIAHLEKRLGDAGKTDEIDISERSNNLRSLFTREQLN